MKTDRTITRTIAVEPAFRVARRVLAAAPSMLALMIAAPAAAEDIPGVPIAGDASAGRPQSDPTGNTAAAGQEEAPADEKEILITGIRGSLQRNLDEKRTASGVVDVISSEDIGKFPDSNVAAALQRLPGVSIQRSGSRGEATGVTVRGFGGDFNDTLYDGRHISTAAGGRGVDFSTVGADFVGKLAVYKTPDVELSTSAIGATIDVQLPKPFDRPGFHAVATLSGSTQSRAKNVVPTGGVLISDTFAGDTFGILADAAYTRRDTVSNQVFIPGWIGNRFYQCQVAAACQTSDFTPANKSLLGWFPQQVGANQVTTRDERIDARIAVQWQPSDDLLLTLDDNFSRQNVRSESYGYGAWFNGDDLRNLDLDSNGTVVDFNQFGTPMDFNAGRARAINQTNQVGANLKWDVSEHLKVEVDGAIARSVLNPGKNGYNDNMDIGYGGTNGDPNGPFLSTGCTYPANATPTTPPTSCSRYSTVLGAPTGVTIGGASSQFLPSIHDVGPANDAGRFTDQAVIGSHVIVRGANYNTDTVKQIRGTIGWEQEGFKIKLGGYYMQDHFTQEGTSTFTNGVFFLYGGYGAPSGRTGAIAPLPAGIYQGTINTSGFIPGYSGNLAPAIIRYDPYAVYSALEATGRGSTAPSFNPASVLDITEKTYAVFLKANFDTEMGGMPLHFAAGVRNEGTRLTAVAIGRDPVSLIIPANDPTLLDPTYTPEQEISRSSSYNYLLPSIDVKLEVTPELVLRLDASRTLTRPALADLRPTVNLGTLRRGSLSASGGNPDLKPYLSDNYDAAVEWYYQRNSYIAANFFLKRLTNFIVGGVSTKNINGVIDPNTNQLAVFNVNGRINGPEATVKGIELAWQHVFGDSGFGFNANATLPSTNREFDPDDISGAAFAVTGLAKSANFVGFYDKNGFQIRGAVNWRDTYLLQLGQNQGGTFGAEPVYVDEQLQIDVSASYDIMKWATVFVEGTNLNNSTYSTHGRFENQVLDVWSYGRRFVFGARFRY
jgi:TonB-dependent receptor